MSFDPLPFERDVFLDKPGITGARWWHKGIQATDQSVSRRNVLLAAMAATAVVAMVGAGVVLASSSGEEATAEVRKEGLEMQRKYGWSFGATSENLVFDGTSTLPFDPTALSRMAADLTPSRGDLRPFQVATLFESLTAVPRAVPAGDPAQSTPLATVLRPISSAGTAEAYRRGRGLAAIFAGRAAEAAVIVDLPGPEAVAFAAGAASAFDVVFAFDNWPHPRGVVPAHRTLAAAAYYQPLFVRARASRPRGSPPMFVLDRGRLAPYADDMTQFDNRHVARLPSAEALAKLGVKRVLYVNAASLETELDDVNEELAAYAARSVDVRMLSELELTAASPAKAAAQPEEEPYYYLGDSVHDGFWVSYPWSTPRRPPPRQTAGPRTSSAWRPTRRTTPFSGGARPSGFATVAVVVASATGAVRGAKMSRSGSWNRSRGGSGG